MAGRTTAGRISPRRWVVRLAWLFAFWVAGIGTMGLAAWLMKAAMQTVGLSAP